MKDSVSKKKLNSAIHELSELADYIDDWLHDLENEGRSSPTATHLIEELDSTIGFLKNLMIDYGE